MVREYQQAQPTARRTRYRRLFAVARVLLNHESAFAQGEDAAIFSTGLAAALLGPDFLTATECSQHFQFWGENDQIGVCAHLETAFAFKANSTPGIFRGHRDHLAQWNVYFHHHRTHKIDHARSAACKRRTVRK